MKDMTCREFDEVVHGFVRMELLDVSLREEAIDHAARCSACAERMTEAVALAEATDTAGKSMQEQETPPHVEAAVMAAFRSHHRRAAWRRTIEWAAMGAAAALVLFFLWTGTSSSRGQSSQSPKKDISTQSDRPVDALAPASSQQPTSSQQGDLTQDADVEVADAATMQTNAASDFVPVTFTEGISPDDPGMIVRVQLTRASLAELGYPLAEAPDEDLIPADVLVGEDGWPRAVRLVQ